VDAAWRRDGRAGGAGASGSRPTSAQQAAECGTPATRKGRRRSANADSGATGRGRTGPKRIGARGWVRSDELNRAEPANVGAGRNGSPVQRDQPRPDAGRDRSAATGRWRRAGQYMLEGLARGRALRRWVNSWWCCRGGGPDPGNNPNVQESRDPAKSQAGRRRAEGGCGLDSSIPTIGLSSPSMDVEAAARPSTPQGGPVGRRSRPA